MEFLWSALLGLILTWVVASLLLGPEIMTVPTQAVGRFIKRFLWPIFRPACRAIARFGDKHVDALFYSCITIWIVVSWVACSWLVYGLLFT